MEWKIILNISALPSEKCSHRTASESALTLYPSAVLRCAGTSGSGDRERGVLEPGCARDVPGMCQERTTAKRSVLLSKGNSLLLHSPFTPVVSLHL